MRSSREVGLSRADLAKATGLMKSVVGLLVQDLIDSGWLCESDVQVTGAIGRRPTPLGLDDDAWRGRRRRQSRGFECSGGFAEQEVLQVCVQASPGAGGGKVCSPRLALRGGGCCGRGAFGATLVARGRRGRSRCGARSSRGRSSWRQTSAGGIFPFMRYSAPNWRPVALPICRSWCRTTMTWRCLAI